MVLVSTVCDLCQRTVLRVRLVWACKCAPTRRSMTQIWVIPPRRLDSRVDFCISSRECLGGRVSCGSLAPETVHGELGAWLKKTFFLLAPTSLSLSMGALFIRVLPNRCLTSLLYPPCAPGQCLLALLRNLFWASILEQLILECPIGMRPSFSLQHFDLTAN
jgi:hypothetical protein